jgi:hypothetical protein
MRACPFGLCVHMTLVTTKTPEPASCTVLSSLRRYGFRLWPFSAMTWAFAVAKKKSCRMGRPYLIAQCDETTAAGRLHPMFSVGRLGGSGIVVVDR